MPRYLHTNKIPARTTCNKMDFNVDSILMFRASRGFIRVEMARTLKSAREGIMRAKATQPEEFIVPIGDWFGVKVKGNSMLPHVRDGNQVSLVRVDPRRAGRYVGRAVVVYLKDGRRTFKRLAAVGRSSLELRADNAKEFPEPWIVKRSDVLILAVAEIVTIDLD